MSRPRPEENHDFTGKVGQPRQPDGGHGRDHQVKPELRGALGQTSQITHPGRARPAAHLPGHGKTQGGTQAVPDHQGQRPGQSQNGAADQPKKDGSHVHRTGEPQQPPEIPLL